MIAATMIALGLAASTVVGIAALQSAHRHGVEDAVRFLVAHGHLSEGLGAALVVRIVERRRR